jgi:FKBP-type peptidyl-prolyl cis-trans isomerase
MTSDSRRKALQARTTRRTALPNPAAPILSALLAAIVLQAAPAFAQDAPKTDDEKAFYAIGLGQGRQLQGLAPVSDRELDMFVLAIRDALAGNEPAIDPQKVQPLVRKMVTERQERATAAEREAGVAFAAAQAKTKGARTTESGLVYIETKAGSGASPAPTDRVRVHYHGTLRDGTVFDSSVDRGQPAEFMLNRVIPCWTEGVAMMKPGGKSTLICPAKIAYGDRGAPPSIRPGATLRFDVELIEVLE